MKGTCIFMAYLVRQRREAGADYVPPRESCAV